MKYEEEFKSSFWLHVLVLLPGIAVSLFALLIGVHGNVSVFDRIVLIVASVVLLFGIIRSIWYYATMSSLEVIVYDDKIVGVSVTRRVTSIEWSNVVNVTENSDRGMTFIKITDGNSSIKIFSFVFNSDDYMALKERIRARLVKAEGRIVTF